MKGGFKLNSLQEIEAATKEILTPADIAPIIGVDPHTIRLAARSMPSSLGFPVICIGTRVKIPRRAFIAFMKGVQVEAKEAPL